MVITVLNIYGVRLVAIINNTGVLFEILGMVVFALIMIAFHNHQGFKRGHQQHRGLHILSGRTPSWSAMFMSLFVIYGFDTASTLAEETSDPRRAAPKAVLFSIIGAFIIGGVFLLGTLMAIPNLHAAHHRQRRLRLGPAQIIEANFSPPFATIYLLVVSAAIFVCCLSIMAATIRLCFGMSRDNQLPFSKVLSKVAPSLHTPVWSCVAVAVVAAIPFIQFSGAGIIAIAATGDDLLQLLPRQHRDPAGQAEGLAEDRRAVQARPVGLLVNIVGLLYGGAMLVNFAWPRAASQPDAEPAAALNFHVGFLNGIPILWTVFVVIVLIGAIYYARRRAGARSSRRSWRRPGTTRRWWSEARD